MSQRLQDNASPQASSRNSAETVLLAPVAGQDLRIDVVAGARYLLDFQTDTAALERSGEDLVFSFPDGARIVLAGFFAETPTGALPDFVLPEGETLSGHDFLAAIDPDLLPAAGPGAGAGGASGGVGEYDDNAGNLIDGVDRLDPLSTVYWDRATEPRLEDEGPIDTAVGALSLTLLPTTPEGVIANTLGGYEDNRPGQHLGDDSEQPLRLDLVFTPADNEELVSLTLTGFDAGTTISIGDPAFGGATILVTDPTQAVTFTPGQIAAGIFVRPPEDSSHDMNISASAVIRDPDSGLTDTITGKVDLIIDAVADKPDLTVDADSAGAREETPVAVHVEGTFTDLDGSERHYIEVRDIPTDWVLSGSLPEGWVVVDPVTHLPIAIPGHALGENGTYTLCIEVTSATTAHQGGVNSGDSWTAQADLTFDPRDWSDERHGDGTPRPEGAGGTTLTVAAVAEENSATDGEVSTANNRSETSTTITVSRTEDHPDIVRETADSPHALTLEADESAELQHFSTKGDIPATALSAGVVTLLGEMGLSAGDMLSATNGQVRFDLHSDGTDDGTAATPSQTGIQWDAQQPLGGIVLHTTDGNHPISLIVETTADGHSVLRGVYVDDTGVSRTAFIAAIEASDLSRAGSADVTFIQFAAIAHPDGSTPDEALRLPFTFTVTDDEGDKASSSVQVVLHDDGPVASSETVAFDEARDDPLEGNVLLNDHAGVDGFAPEGGVSTYSVTVGNTTYSGIVPGHSVTIYNPGTNVPAGSFTLNADGSYVFTRSPGQDIADTFTLKVGYTVKDGDGDTDTATLSIKLNAAPTLNISISGDSQAYEDAAHGTRTNPAGSAGGSDGWNASGDGAHTIATYNVNWSYANNAPVAGTYAAGAFSFDVSLKGVSQTPATTPSKVYFDADTTNNTSMADTGDITWAVPDGSGGWKAMHLDLTTAAGKDALMSALNDALDDVYGGKLRVTGVTSDGKLTFTVSDGCPLGAPLPVHVAILDDMVSDSGEKYTVQLGNIRPAEGTPSTVDVAISGNREQSTTIYDEGNAKEGDGFRVGLESPVTAQESDGTAQVTVVLYDANGNVYSAAEPPLQSITVNLAFGAQAGGASDTATANADYFTSASHTFSPDSWVRVQAADGSFHWEAKIPVALADDRRSEGSEQFTVKLTGVSGHEASILTGKDTSKVTIVDDTADGHTAKLDGPSLEHFGADTVLREPVAPGDSAVFTPDGEHASANGPVNTVGYTIALTQVAAEDVVVWIKLNTAGLGKDFRPGAGLHDADPGYANRPEGANYYVIVKGGTASAHFNVDVLHDHDTAGDGRGQDTGSDDIGMTIVDMQGSEVVYDPTHPAKTSDTIADDMRGPVVEIAEFAPSQTSGTTTGIKVHFKEGSTANEDVTVNLEIVKSNGDVEVRQVVIKAGETSGTLHLDVPGTDYYHVRVAGSNGGETRHDDAFKFVDVHGTGGGGGIGNGRVELSLTASDSIAEDGGRTTYVVEGRLPSDYLPLINGQPVTFTLKTFGNGATEGTDFSAGEVTVTMSSWLMSRIKWFEGGKFTLKLEDDGHGNITPTLYDSNGNDFTPLLKSSLTIGGTLPHGINDHLIEGSEGFTTVLTGLSGNATFAGNGSGTTARTEIIDDDQPRVIVTVTDHEGNATNSGTEGQDHPLTVTVSLEDALGHPLQLGDGPVTFNLTFTGTGVQGKDFVPYTTTVTIPAGGSASSIKISLPDDFVSDGDRTFKVTATPVTNDPYNGYPAGTIGSGTSGEITIVEHVDGPDARLVATTGTSISENGGSAGFRFTMDKASEEDVTATVRIDFKNGLTEDDLAGVKIGNGTVGTGGITRIYAEDGSGTVVGWKFEVTLPKGSAGGGDFSIVTKNDYITEGQEKFTVSVSGVNGGEVDTVSGVHTVTVNDTLDGPQVYLDTTGSYATAQEGGSAEVHLGMTKNAVADFTANLKVLTPEVLEPGSHATLMVKMPGGDFVAHGPAITINPDGTFSVTIPEGAADAKVVFQTANDGVVGVNGTLEVAIAGVNGGETAIRGGVTVTSAFVEETYSSMTQQLTGNTVPSGKATTTYTLNGVSFADVASVRVDGAIVSVRQDSSGRAVFTVTSSAGASISDRVVVSFRDNANLTANKANLNVTGKVAISGVVTIIDTTPHLVAADTTLVALTGDDHLHAASGSIHTAALLAGVNDPSPHAQGIGFDGDASAMQGIGHAGSGWTVGSTGDLHFDNLTADASFTYKAYDRGNTADADTAKLDVHVVNGTVFDGSDGAHGTGIVVSGSGGGDTITGTNGNDHIYGGAGDDILHGGSGNDHLYGGAGNDQLYGGAGNDVLDGGTGRNLLDGGAGDDILIVRDTSGDGVITSDDIAGLHGGEGLDTLVVEGDGTHLDFTAFAKGMVTSIERIDLNAQGAQDVRLSAEDVLDMGGAVHVTGSSADSVHLADAGEWSLTGTRNVAGTDYNVFSATVSVNGHEENVQLLVQTLMTTT